MQQAFQKAERYQIVVSSWNRVLIFPAPVPLNDRQPVPNLFRAGAFSPLSKTKIEKEEAMKFRPLHDRVVVKRVDAEEKTKGGIIIPDTAKEKPQEGEVVAVGPGGRDESGKLIPIDLKVGDRILFGKWSGTDVVIDGEELLIMKESDVMGVVEGGAKPARKAA
jgi:chaperonin GroES